MLDVNDKAKLQIVMIVIVGLLCHHKQWWSFFSAFVPFIWCWLLMTKYAQRHKKAATFKWKKRPRSMFNRLVTATISLIQHTAAGNNNNTLNVHAHHLHYIMFTIHRSAKSVCLFFPDFFPFEPRVFVCAPFNYYAFTFNNTFGDVLPCDKTLKCTKASANPTKYS